MIRRTIRKYSSQTVPDALLQSLLSQAMHASNTGNMQTYSVILTRDEAQKAALAPAHFAQPMVTQAPVVLTFCADYNRFSSWCQQRKAVPGYDNFQSFVAAMIDTCLFAQTFCDLAEKQGLGLCYLGTTTYNAGDIIRVLQLPRLVVPICTITLGYPAESPAVQDRLPLDAVLHQETYQAYSPASIDAFYQAKEALASSQQFVAENQKETLAQVFTDIRYTRANNEHFSQVFLDVLRQQGFLSE